MAWWKLRPNQLLLPSARESASQPTSVRNSDDELVVREFRSKLRLAEEMIEKLRFNLREIRETWRKTD